MARVIGKTNPGSHQAHCPKCGVWFEFTNNEIYRDEVVCPNCNEWVIVG